MKKLKHELLHLLLGALIFAAGAVFNKLHQEHHGGGGESPLS